MGDNSKLTSYFFAVELDGIESAHFRKCCGLEAETEVIEIEEGGGGVHRFKGRTRFPNLVLEQGICDNDELLKWFRNWLEGKTERKSGSVVLYDLEYNEIQRWNFFRAFPCRWVGPKLDCKMRDTLAVERIEIAHEGLELDDAYASDSSGDSFWSKFADGVQAGLDIAGLVPGVGELADGVNALISLGRGDVAGAALSATSMLPIVGDAIGKGGKIARAAIKHGDEIVEGTKDSARIIKNARQRAVRNAWKQEKEMVEITGQGTRRWTKSELKELVETGKVKGYQGHHINNVKDHPEMAGNPNNVEFLNKTEHLESHGGNYRNMTEGPLLNRSVE